MSQNFQNWEPVVLKKTVKKTTKGPNINENYIKMKKLEDNNDVPIKQEMVSDEDRRFIQTSRVQKKISQDELTKLMCLKKDTIKEIENGKHPKNNLLVNKIKKFLTNYQTTTDV